MRWETAQETKELQLSPDVGNGCLRMTMEVLGIQPGEMALWVTCLLQKCGDLSMISSMHVKGRHNSMQL